MTREVSEHQLALNLVAASLRLPPSMYVVGNFGLGLQNPNARPADDIDFCFDSAVYPGPDGKRAAGAALDKALREAAWRLNLAGERGMPVRVAVSPVEQIDLGPYGAPEILEPGMQGTVDITQPLELGGSGLTTQITIHLHHEKTGDRSMRVVAPKAQWLGWNVSGGNLVTATAESIVAQKYVWCTGALTSFAREKDLVDIAVTNNRGVLDYAVLDLEFRRLEADPSPVFANDRIEEALSRAGLVNDERTRRTLCVFDAVPLLFSSIGTNENLLSMGINTREKYLFLQQRAFGPLIRHGLMTHVELASRTSQTWVPSFGVDTALGVWSSSPIGRAADAVLSFVSRDRAERPPLELSHPVISPNTGIGQ